MFRYLNQKIILFALIFKSSIFYSFFKYSFFVISISFYSKYANLIMYLFNLII